MSKIYANESKDWLKLDRWVQILFYPRWWNPLFILLALFFPLILAIIDAANKLGESDVFYTYFDSLSEYNKEIALFFHKYKI